MTDQRAEENEYPKLVGNMIVLERHPTTGYKLMCSCEQQFNFVPSFVNSVDMVDQGLRKRAMCPSCKAVWLEDAQFNQKKSVLYFVCYASTENEEPQLRGIGKAFSRSDAINIASNGLREDHEQFDLFTVKFLTEEEYYKLQAAQEHASALRGATLLAAFTGINLGEMLKGKSSGRKPRKE